MCFATPLQGESKTPRLHRNSKPITYCYVKSMPISLFLFTLLYGSMDPTAQYYLLSQCSTTMFRGRHMAIVIALSPTNCFGTLHSYLSESQTNLFLSPLLSQVNICFSLASNQYLHLVLIVFLLFIMFK